MPIRLTRMPADHVKHARLFMQGSPQARCAGQRYAAETGACGAGEAAH
jgi:hypothetical protein